MKRTLPMTGEEIERAYRQAKDPAAQIEILAQLNAVPRSTIAALLARRGALLQETLTAAKDRSPVKRRMAERLEFYRQGLSDREIARRTGADPSSVRGWRKRNGLPPNFRQGWPREKGGREAP